MPLRMYGSMLCIRNQYGWLNAVHPRFSDVHQASVWFNAVYQASIWLNAVQELFTYAEICAKHLRSRAMAKVTSHAFQNNAILYIPHMHIVRQTTPCTASSNMQYPVCTMLLARYARASSWHAMQDALSWLLLCYSYHTGSMLSSIIIAQYCCFMHQS